jgi:hypothetical protein
VQFDVEADSVVGKLLPFKTLNKESRPAGHPAGGRIVHPVAQLEPEQARIAERPRRRR